MGSPLRDFQDALIVRNVVARVTTAKEFPSNEALEEYLKKHPGADRSKHKVVKEDEAKLKKDLKDFKKIEKGQQDAAKKREKRKDERDKKEDSDRFDKLKKELDDWKNAK